MEIIKLSPIILFLQLTRRLGLAGIFLFETILTIFFPPYSIHRLFKQIAFVGSRSMLVIIVAGLFVGMVLALQFYDTLVRFGSISLLGSAVGLSLIRELGPVLTGLIVAGRAGSCIVDSRVQPACDIGVWFPTSGISSSIPTLQYERCRPLLHRHRHLHAPA